MFEVTKENIKKFLSLPHHSIFFIETADYSRVQEKIRTAVLEYNKEISRELADTPYEFLVFSPGRTKTTGTKFKWEELLAWARTGKRVVIIFRNMDVVNADPDSFVELIESSMGRPSFKIFVMSPHIEISPIIKPYVIKMQDFYPAKDEVLVRTYIPGMETHLLMMANESDKPEEYKRIIVQSFQGIINFVDYEKVKNIDKAIGLEKVIDFIETVAASGLGQGTMLGGVPGTGKSLVYKQLALRQYQNKQPIPVVFWNISRAFDRYLGETERKIDEIFEVLDKIKPVFVVIDEFEKIIGQNGTQGLHEVTLRLIGKLLTWMQDKDPSIYPVVTVNDLTKIAPEMMRRFDLVFGFTPPPREIKAKIVEYYANKYQVDPRKDMIDAPHIVPADIEKMHRLLAAGKGKIDPDFITKAFKPISMFPNFMESLRIAKQYTSLVYEEENNLLGGVGINNQQFWD